MIRFLLPAALALAFAATAFAATPGTLPRSPLLGVPGGPVLAAEDTIPIPSALLPEYVESIDENEVVMRNFKGERYVYRQPKGPAQPRRHMSEPEYLLQAL